MSSAIEAGKAFVAIFAKDETKKELAKIGARFKAWGAGIAAVGGGMVAASAAVGTAMAAAVGEFVKVGGAIDDMSGRTGIAREALQEIGFAAMQGGASMEDLEQALRAMSRVTGKGGIDNFLMYADAISKIEDPGKRAQEAMRLFGKSGTKLLPMLADGAAGIQKMREQARLMGVVLSEDDSKAADKLGDALDQLKGTFRGIALQVGAALAPIAQFLVDGLQPIVTTVVRLIKENRGLVQGFAVGAAVVGALGSALMVAGGVLAGVGALLAALPSIVAGVSAAIGVATTVIGAILSPIGLTVIAVAALVAGLVALGAWFLTSTTAGQQFTAFLTTGFKQLLGVASQTFKGIADALASGNLALAGKVAMSGLNVVFQSAVNGLKMIWASFTEYIVSHLTGAIAKAAKLLDTLASKAGIDLGLGTAAGNSAGAINSLLKANNDKNLAKSNGELSKAVAEWQATLKEAADAKASTVAAAKLPGGLELPPPAMMKQLASSAAGTFSGFAASLLGRAGGASPAERTAKATEKIADKMDDLIDAVEDAPGLAFGAG